MNDEGEGGAPEMELNENRTPVEVEDGVSAEQKGDEGELEEVLVGP